MTPETLRLPEPAKSLMRTVGALPHSVLPPIAVPGTGNGCLGDTSMWALRFEPVHAPPHRELANPDAAWLEDRHRARFEICLDGLQIG